MYCSKCGIKNEDSVSYCSSCGSILRTAQMPPIVQIPSPPPASPSYYKKPYRAEFSLGLTGAIIGSIFFIILLVLSIDELSGYSYIEGMITLTAVFCLASFILGFVGIAKIGGKNLNGGIPLVVGAGLSFIAMFFSPAGFVTVFYWPLLLAGGITSLARKSHLQKNNSYQL